MMFVLRLNVLSLVLLLLGYGLIAEHHEVTALSGGAAVSVNGAEMIRAAASEDYALSQGTLVAEKPPSGALSVRLKDCKT